MTGTNNQNGMMVFLFIITVKLWGFHWVWNTLAQCQEGVNGSIVALPSASMETLEQLNKIKTEMGT